MRPTRFTLPAMDASAVCASQTTAGSGSLVINGTLLELPATMQACTRVVLPGIQRQLRIASLGDLSAVAFTITGKNVKKETVTETILGPSPVVNGGVVDTINEFGEVDSITVNGAVGTAVTVGTGPNGHTNWVKVDQFKNPQSVGILVSIASSLALSVETTPDDVNTVAAPATFIPEPWTDVSASVSAPLGAPASAVRAAFAASGDGSASFTIAQAGS